MKLPLSPCVCMIHCEQLTATKHNPDGSGHRSLASNHLAVTSFINCASSRPWPKLQSSARELILDLVTHCNGHDRTMTAPPPPAPRVSNHACPRSSGQSRPVRTVLCNREPIRTEALERGGGEKMKEKRKKRKETKAIENIFIINNAFDDWVYM